MPLALPPTSTKYRGMFFADKHTKIQVLRGLHVAMAEITSLVDVVFLEAFYLVDTENIDVTTWSAATIDTYLKGRGFDHHPEMALEYRKVLEVIAKSGKACFGVDNTGGGFSRSGKKWNDANWVPNIKKVLLARGGTTFALFGGSAHANGLQTPMAMSFQGYEWRSLGQIWAPFVMGPTTEIIYRVPSGPARNSSKRLECCLCHSHNAAEQVKVVMAQKPGGLPYVPSMREPTHGKMPSVVNLWHICNRCESAYCPIHGAALGGKRSYDATRDCQHCMSRTVTLLW